MDTDTEKETINEGGEAALVKSNGDMEVDDKSPEDEQPDINLEESDKPPVDEKIKSEQSVDNEEAVTKVEKMDIDSEEAIGISEKVKTEDPDKVDNADKTSSDEAEDKVKTETMDTDEDQIKADKANDSKSEDKTEDVKDLTKKEDIVNGNGALTNGVDSVDEPLFLGKKVNGHAKSDQGSVHSEDSEKENMNIDLPIDLSRKQPSGEDVIMLSEETDHEPMSGRNGDRKYSVDELKIKRKMIKRLQAELRNEEAKLVLLKKLRMSQISPQVQEIRKPQTGHQSQPPPLVRGNQPQMQQAKPAHSQPAHMARGNVQNIPNKSQQQGPPPLVIAPRMDQREMLQNRMKLLQQQQQQQQQLKEQQLKEQQQRAMSNSSQQSSLPGFRGNQQAQAQAEAIRAMQHAQQRVVEETPAQRQAAAKLALRKQLEKTLLQIPPPKPPPPEMNFIPSLASPDFVYLLGLEESVNFIIDTNLISKGRKNPDEKMVCNPFTCVQCGTDFTPVWKREKPGSKNVICEQCVTTNQKKALKQEHTNRLKSAFVKALQQEQEIERMQSQEAKSSASSAPKEKPEPRERDRERERDRDREREPRERDVSSAAQRSAAQTYKETMAETLRQHQNLLQAHQVAALRMGQPLGLQAFNPRASPFPYQMPFSARASDLQRQYLLDMIPKGGLPWNS